MNNMEEKKVVKYQAFPDPLAPDEVKATKEYGLKWGAAIAYEWFHRSRGGSSVYHNRQAQFHDLRLYARGEQSEDIYKDLISPDKESYTNYDWRPLQIIPKFVKLIVNQMSERLFEVKANAIDSYSTDLRDEHRRNMENLMASKEMLTKAKELLAVDNLPEDVSSVPDSQEEIDLHMQLKYKPAIEIAAETAIKYTLDLNDYDETQSKVLEDIAVIGIGATRNYTDPGKGIMVEWIDPAQLVYSSTQHRDFKDAYYYGHVEKMTVGELRRISDLKNMSDDELKNLGSDAKAWNAYHSYTSRGGDSDNDIDGMMVDVLHFTFKAQNTPTYKKKYTRDGKGFKLIPKDSTFEKADPKYKGYDVVKRSNEVWYEGSLVLGTEHIFNYKMSENMVKQKGHLNRTLPCYSVYAPEIYQGRIKSLVGRITQYVDQMQQIHIKIQQMIAKARPSGIYIDVDGLNDIPLGDGKFLTPLELVKIYDETGNVLGSSLNAEGSYNYGREPIRELKNGVIDGIDRLINTYNHYLNQLRDAIGIPAGMDASNPHPDTLVGVQQQVALNSNTATRHVLDSVLHITRRTATGVSLRLKDIFKYSNLKEAYISAIGKVNVDVLDSLKNYHLHDFGVLIELRPDMEERQYLEKNIQIALDREAITLDDAIDIRDINNIRLANELLKIRRQRREKDKKQHEERMIKVSAEENAKAAERTAQAKQAEIKAKEQADINVANAKGSHDIRKIEAEKAAKAELMSLEFNYNLQLQGVKVNADLQAKQMAEDRKDKRQDRNNTQASELADQKMNNGPVRKFESSEDNISGQVEMSELEPS